MDCGIINTVIKMEKKRIVFMGTASFSEAVLKMLIEEGYDVVGVVSQPDRYVGRKKVLTYPLVKTLALQHHIPVFQPVKIRSDYALIESWKPDIIVTAAYGQIIPKALLDLPPLGCINVHASLLPLLRGGAPVHKAIIEDHSQTGVTIMYMAEKMDAGDMISQRAITIEPRETMGELYERLTILGASLLKDTLPSILNGTSSRQSQDESLVTFAKTISREEERIDWHLSARQVDCLVRGLNPAPASYTLYQGKTIKIYAGQEENHDSSSLPGTILSIDKQGILVQCGDHRAYRVTELQVEGKKRMLVKDYLNGHSIFEIHTCFDVL